jgi:serine/threonine protein kinase
MEFAYGLMSALEAVHLAGVIHRDIKPSNILMSASGPKVIDFGISFSSDATSLTKTGMVAGTPAWFAPEQFEARKITGAVDNFAAGSVLYFAATGMNPWGRDDTSVANTMHMILNKEADFTVLTEAQREVISLLHKKSPKERSTASEILARLESINDSLGKEPTQKKSRFGIKTKAGKAVAALIAGLVGVGSYYLYSQQPLGEATSVLASPSPTVSKEIEWSLEIVGDPNPQVGIGKTYSFFICDQDVIKDSLKLRELTNPPADKQPKVDLKKGDSRCGKDFDTIVISGEVDVNKNRRNYVLAGTTLTGFIIQYEYNIRITN